MKYREGDSHMWYIRHKYIYKADFVIIFFALYSLIALTGLTAFQSVLLTLIFTILAYCLFSYRYIGTAILTLCSIVWSWLVTSILPMDKLPTIAVTAVYIIIFMAVLSIHNCFERISKDVITIVKKDKDNAKETKKAEEKQVDYDTSKIDLTVVKAELTECYNHIKDKKANETSFYFIGSAGTNVIMWIEPIEVPGTFEDYFLGCVRVMANIEDEGPAEIESFMLDEPNDELMYSKLLEYQERYFMHYCKIFKSTVQSSPAQGYYNAFVYASQFIDGIHEHWCAGTKDRTAEKQRAEQNTETRGPVAGEELFEGCTDLKSLTKRYHELMKKYHPDNTNGDVQMAQTVQIAYAELKKRYQ